MLLTLLGKKVMTYHTQKPKHNIEYLGLREEILSKFYAHDSFQETDDPSQNERLNINSSYHMHYTYAYIQCRAEHTHYQKYALFHHHMLLAGSPQNDTCSIPQQFLPK